MSIIANKHRRFFNLALTFILFLFTATSIHAQTLRERHDRIRQAIDTGDPNAVLPNLEALRLAEPNIFGFNNYDYLLARISEQLGSTAKAAANYQTVLARNSVLRQYALWHLAHIARATGNLMLERDQLRRLIAFAPTIVLRDAAKARLAESFFESGDYASTIEILRLHTDPAYTDAPDREALALVGQAYYRNGMKQAARQVFNNLVARIPDPKRPDDYALAAVRGLDTLAADEAKQGTNNVTPISENEHLQRANIYNFNREFEAARPHYLAITTADPQGANAVDALYQIGRGFYQQRRFDEALQWFGRVIEKSPEGNNNASVRDAFSFKASALARLKRTDEAVAAYQDIINRFPDAPDAERPYLNIIDALRDGGRDTEALLWVDKTRARFGGQNAAARALFEQARIHQGEGVWAAALADFDALRDAGDFDEQRNSVSNETTQSEIALMRGATLEQLNRFDEAINVYLSLPDGRNQYYGGRATRRLRFLALDPRTRDATATRVHALLAEARQAKNNREFEQAQRAAQSAWRVALDDESTRESLAIARQAYAAIPAYSNVPAAHVEDAGRRDIRTKNFNESNVLPAHKAIADELLFLGLYDEGAPEWALAENSSDDAKLALLFMRGDMVARAIRYAEPLWKNVPADYLLELAPRETLEMLYPAPYKHLLLESAVPRNLDPRFALAIARQESRFQPGAKSVAAARGLLQFISSTSNDIATRLGVRDFEQDELYDPATVLLFGSEYMKNLFQQFPDMPEAVAASYNGGEDNVARWVSRAHSNDPDLYVAEIGFAQSKDYVTKVLPNFWAYQTLYTKGLQRR